MLVAFAVFCGCGQKSASVERQGEKLTKPSASADGGTSVGEKLAQAKLEPVSDSGTSGTAVFKEVGNLGVQAEIHVSGLPTKDPNATYFAQVHEGSCSHERRGEDHEEEHGAAPDSALALIRLGELVGNAPRLQAHGGHGHGVPEAPFGSIEQPIILGGSADSTSSVTSLLEGVKAERLTSGDPEYVHLHDASSEDAPDLACGDLVGVGRPGLDKP